MVPIRTQRDNLRKELKRARKAARMTQAEVASALGKPQSYIAKVENGERRIDLVETLALCQALNFDPKELIDLIT